MLLVHQEAAMVTLNILLRQRCRFRSWPLEQHWRHPCYTSRKKLGSESRDEQGAIGLSLPIDYIRLDGALMI